MKKNRFVIVTHVAVNKDTEIAGPAHTIVSYLKQKKAEILFIRHSIYGDGKTFITTIKGKDGKNKSVTKNRSIGELTDRLHEGLITISSCLKLFPRRGNMIYIGADPLNTLWGVVLKKVGKVDTLITFNTDYAPRKYSNYFYNIIYSFLDIISLKTSDYIL